jgi:acyl carrier protein
MKFFEKTSVYGRFPSDIEKGVRETVLTHVGGNKDTLTSKTSLVKDLGADKLDHVELIMNLEKNFNTSIPDKDFEKIKTVGDIIKYIGKK